MNFCFIIQFRLLPLRHGQYSLFGFELQDWARKIWVEKESTPNGSARAEIGTMSLPAVNRWSAGQTEPGRRALDSALSPLAHDGRNPDPPGRLAALERQNQLVARREKAGDAGATVLPGIYIAIFQDQRECLQPLLRVHASVGQDLTHLPP